MAGNHGGARANAGRPALGTAARKESRALIEQQREYNLEQFGEHIAGLKPLQVINYAMMLNMAEGNVERSAYWASVLAPYTDARLSTVQVQHEAGLKPSAMNIPQLEAELLRLQDARKVTLDTTATSSLPVMGSHGK